MLALILNKTRNLIGANEVMGYPKFGDNNFNQTFYRPSNVVVQEMEDLDEETILKKKQDLKDAVYGEYVDCNNLRLAFYVRMCSLKLLC